MKPIKIFATKELNAYHDTLDKKSLCRDGAERKAELGAEAAAMFSEWRDRIADVVTEANGKATTHTYTPHDIVKIAIAAEVEMRQRGVTLANMPGTLVNARSGLPTAKAYKNAAIAGFACIERKTAGWYLVSYHKDQCYTGPGAEEKLRYQVTEDAAEDIARKSMKDISIIRQPIIKAA